MGTITNAAPADHRSFVRRALVESTGPRSKYQISNSCRDRGDDTMDAPTADLICRKLVREEMARQLADGRFEATAELRAAVKQDRESLAVAAMLPLADSPASSPAAVAAAPPVAAVADTTPKPDTDWGPLLDLCTTLASGVPVLIDIPDWDDRAKFAQNCRNRLRQKLGMWEWRVNILLNRKLQVTKGDARDISSYTVKTESVQAITPRQEAVGDMIDLVKAAADGHTSCSAPEPQHFIVPVLADLQAKRDALDGLISTLTELYGIETWPPVLA